MLQKNSYRGQSYFRPWKVAQNQSNFTDEFAIKDANQPLPHLPTTHNLDFVYV